MVPRGCEIKKQCKRPVWKGMGKAVAPERQNCEKLVSVSPGELGLVCLLLVGEQKVPRDGHRPIPLDLEVKR